MVFHCTLTHSREELRVASQKSVPLSQFIVWRHLVGYHSDNHRTRPTAALRGNLAHDISRGYGQRAEPAAQLSQQPLEYRTAQFVIDRYNPMVGQKGVIGNVLPHRVVRHRTNPRSAPSLPFDLSVI